MAQWSGGFSGLTHETKVADLEATLRRAVATARARTGAASSKSVTHLAERLLGARRKALESALSRLGGSDTADDHRGIARRLEALEASGTAGILREFLREFDAPDHLTQMVQPGDSQFIPR